MRSGEWVFRWPLPIAVKIRSFLTTAFALPANSDSHIQRTITRSAAPPKYPTRLLCLTFSPLCAAPCYYRRNNHPVCLTITGPSYSILLV